MWDRRRFLSHSGLALAGLAGTAAGLPGEVSQHLSDGSASKGMITEAAQQVIQQGLAYLRRNRHEDGSFGTGQYRGVAITSLGGLAMMSGGHLPGRGIYGDVVAKALRYVLSQEDKAQAGYLHSRHDPRHDGMYSHGFGTLFLAEAHGTVPEPGLAGEVRDLLKKAVQHTLASQNGEGGWRYEPRSREADISVTVCQIMALRAGRNVGIDVPKEKVDKCIEYVKRCQDRDGGFRYMAQGGPTGFARTAAGVAALLCAGIYKGRELESGLKYLMQYKPNPHTPYYSHPYNLHYFYGHYYAAQAMWTAGGTYWQEWYPGIRDELIRTNRRSDGGWHDTVCSHYATALACIILQIPNNYLPILQK
jgi:hypothetical protein